jgi:hypothetical protein
MYNILYKLNNKQLVQLYSSLPVHNDIELQNNVQLPPQYMHIREYIYPSWNWHAFVEQVDLKIDINVISNCLNYCIIRITIKFPMVV